MNYMVVILQLVDLLKCEWDKVKGIAKLSFGVSERGKKDLHKYLLCG